MQGLKGAGGGGGGEQVVGKTDITKGWLYPLQGCVPPLCLDLD